MRFEQVGRMSAVSAVAVLAVVTVLAWVAGPVVELDLLVARWIETVQQPTGIEILRALGTVGRLEFLAAMLACVAVATARRTGSWIPVGQAAFTVVASNVLVSLLKLATARPAPAAGVADLMAGGVSYPSGHVANAVAAAGCLLAITAATDQTRGLSRGLRISAITLPVIVSVSVLYLNYHWITDVLAGLAIGVLVNSARTLLTATVTSRSLRRGVESTRDLADGTAGY